MEKKEKENIVDKIKKSYPDHDVRTLKNGQRRFIANIKELEIPEDLKGIFGLRLLFDKEKVYLGISIPLGLDPNVKEKRKKERQEKRQVVFSERNAVKLKISSLKKKLTVEFKNQNFSALDSINAEILELEQRLQELKLRK